MSTHFQNLRFLIVDDQKIIRESLSEKLKALFPDCRIMETGEAWQSTNIVKIFIPDIVFMDISMPQMNGIQATRTILSACPDQDIIAFSMNDDDSMLHKMLKAGVKGYLLKTDPLHDYELAIKTVMAGRQFISRNVMKGS